MNAASFTKGTATVGHKEIAFAPRMIRDRFRMYVPTEFADDKNLVSNYTYLFSKDKSPLSIAIKYSTAAAQEDKEKQIGIYFNQAVNTLERKDNGSGGVFYRETVTESKYLSVYSLRFAVDTGSGLLFGCFNCSASYKDDWQPVVLEMLLNIETL